MWREGDMLTEAMDAAARDAAKRGDTSVCGIEIPRAVREAIAAGNASLLLVTTGDKRPVAACLHKRGYLTTAGVEAVEDFERDATRESGGADPQRPSPADRE